MTRQALSIAGMLWFSLHCTARNVVNYETPYRPGLPLRLQIQSTMVMGDRLIPINDYFGDLLMVQIKQMAGERVVFVEANPDLRLVISDDKAYVSIRALDKKGNVLFISVKEASHSWFSWVHEASMRDGVETMARDFSTWLQGG